MTITNPRYHHYQRQKCLIVLMANIRMHSTIVTCDARVVLTRKFLIVPTIMEGLWSQFLLQISKPTYSYIVAYIGHHKSYKCLLLIELFV